MNEPLLNRAFSSRAARPNSVHPSNDGDPFAELARIVGQDDPFGDIFGEAQRAAHAPEAAPRTPAFGDPDPNYAYEYMDAESYRQDEAGEADYADLAAEAGYYDEEAEFEPDISLKKKRTGLFAAGLVTLVVIGGAGFAFYKGGSGPASTGAPPVIHAEPGPTKTVPDAKAAEAPQHSKLIYDRVGAADKPGEEKVVSRAEEPVALPDAPASPQADAPPAASETVSQPQPSAGLPSSDAPAVPGEPRRVRTVLIKPDGSVAPADMGLAAPGAAATQPAAASGSPSFDAAPAAPVNPQPAGYPFSIIENDDLTKPADPAQAAAPSNSGAGASPPAVLRLPPAKPAAPPVSNLERTAVAPAPAPKPAAAPQRTASVPPAAVKPAPAASTGPTGKFAVQLTSQRSEQEARTAYSSLQRRFSSVLGSFQPSIQKADLGARGTYYRVRISTGSREDAQKLCSTLKAQGGDCVVQNN